MKLELKSIKLGPGSEETTQFTAKLYVEGKFAAYCDNAGKGGSTDVRAYEPQERELTAQAEAYCKTLPPKVYSWGNVDMNLENWVDEQVWKIENEKEIKRGLQTLTKKCEKAIVVVSKKLLDDFKAGKPVSLSYRQWPIKIGVANLPDATKRVYVLQVTAKLEGDEFIYNENLPK